LFRRERERRETRSREGEELISSGVLPREERGGKKGWDKKILKIILKNNI
jgi:hypothetical protein